MFRRMLILPHLTMVSYRQRLSLSKEKAQHIPVKARLVQAKAHLAVRLTVSCVLALEVNVVGPYAKASMGSA